MSQFDPLQSPAYQLWLTSNAWQRQVRKVLLPFNLTHVQFVVLAAISLLSEQYDHCVTQIHVARFAGIDENMTSQVIRCLESEKLLEKQKHPTDGRAFRLVLTEKSTPLIKDARAAVKAAAQDFFSPLGERGLELAEMLGTLVEADAKKSGSD